MDTNINKILEDAKKISDPSEQKLFLEKQSLDFLKKIYLLPEKEQEKARQNFRAELDNLVKD